MSECCCPEEICVETLLGPQVAGFPHKNGLVEPGIARLEENGKVLPASGTMNSTPQRILVVDDDPEIRKLLARYIES